MPKVHLSLLAQAVTKMVNGQKGFSLIELLLVLVVLAALVAVAIPTYGHFIGQGEAKDSSRYVGQGEVEANASELAMVQNAMDAMMTNNQISAVNQGPTAGKNVFKSHPKGAGAEALYPDFLRNNPTKCTYSWTTSGRVTQLSCP